jgi:hypothetical protein
LNNDVSALEGKWHKQDMRMVMYDKSGGRSYHILRYGMTEESHEKSLARLASSN